MMVFCVTGQAQHDVNIHELELDTRDGEKSSPLMQLSLGLHLIEPESEKITHLTIGVHGWTSSGYEWIEPLRKVDTAQESLYFFRWDSKTCPSDSASILLTSIHAVIDSQKDLSQITLVGHNLGGVLLMHFLDAWKQTIPTDIHLVAAPLGNTREFIDAEECTDFNFKRIPATVRLFHWMNLHKSDEYYRDLVSDPQLYTLKGGLSITLPKAVDGDAITHQSALAWVANRIREGKRQHNVREQ